MRRISNRYRRKNTLITAEEIYKKTTSHMDSVGGVDKWRLELTYPDPLPNIRFVEINLCEFPANQNAATSTLVVDSTHRTFSFRTREPAPFFTVTSYTFTILAGTYTLSTLATTMQTYNNMTGSINLTIAFNDTNFSFTVNGGYSIGILGMTELSSLFGIVGNPTYTTYASSYSALFSLMPTIKRGNDHVKLVSATIPPTVAEAPDNDSYVTKNFIRLSINNRYYNRIACYRHVALYELPKRQSIQSIYFHLCDDDEVPITMLTGSLSMTVNFYS